MNTKRVVVIGGGPSGMMAAGQAARGGADVLLLEKMKQPGRKLGLTGKGRCNITNTAAVDDFLVHFGKSGRFLHQSFSRWFVEDLISFMDELGVPLVKERGGRVFPAGGRAPDVVRALRRWLKSSGVQIKCSSAVSELLVQDSKIVGVVANETKFDCDSIVLATGGVSYPATGSTGDGYRFAKSVHHTIIPVRPALAPLVVAEDTTAMAGLGLRNVKVRVFVNGKKKREEFGEVAFTDCAVTGPVILTISGDVVDALGDGAEVVLSIDLKPALGDEKLDARLLRDIAKRGSENSASVLRGLLPRELIPYCLKSTGISGSRPASRINAKERRRLLEWLKDFRLQVVDHRPIDEAIVTAGGVDTREVDPNTMESRLVSGLYFAGEILDVNADTGGYNLQAAFSTGWLAGVSAASSKEQ